MFPFFSFTPLGGQLGSQQLGREEVPARVRAAMDFLQALTLKTMPRVAVNDMAMEEFPGQKLSGPEADAAADACRMLSAYFAGELQPSKFEKKALTKGRGAGTLIRCFSCMTSAASPPRPDCFFCKGSGELFVAPVHGGNNLLRGSDDESS